MQAVSAGEPREEHFIVVPDSLLEKLTSLRVSYARLLRQYRRELQNSPKAQEVFVETLPGLLHRKFGLEHNFQSYFDTFVNDETSLFNVFYLKHLCDIFPEDVCAITKQLVVKYEEQLQHFMTGTTVNQFKEMFPALAIPSKLSTGKIILHLKRHNKWGDSILSDLTDLVSLFDISGYHIHYSIIRDRDSPWSGKRIIQHDQDVHSLEVSLQASKEKTQMLQSERDSFQSQLHAKEEEYAKLDDDHFDLKKKMLSLEFDYKQQQQMLEALHKKVMTKSAAVDESIQVDDPSLSIWKEEYQQLQKELEQTKKMCYARDTQILSLHEAIPDESHPLQRSYKSSESPVDKAVQANYLAMAPDFLRGVDIHGEIVLEVVGDKPQKVEWPGYGFYIEVPEGALPPGVTASVAVKMILGGPFQFPENRQLISALYWIFSSEMFLKEVAVNIQHCAVIKNEEECSTFRFIIAKCSQEVLPYRFKEREGVFNPHTQYGTIKLKQFSIVGETASADEKLHHTALMLYKQRTASPLSVNFHLVVVMDLEPLHQEVKKKYQGWSLDYSFEVIFIDTAHAIELDQQEEKVDTWKIVPLVSPPKITKDNVTSFQKGRSIPHCPFVLKLLPGKDFQELLHKVKLKGVSHPDSFCICYPLSDDSSLVISSSPPPTSSDTESAHQPANSQHESTTTVPATLPDSSAESEALTTTLSQQVQATAERAQEKVATEPLGIDKLVDVLNALEGVNDWHSLGLQLGILYPTLEKIKKDNNHESDRCKTEMIAAWLNKEYDVLKFGVPSWSVLKAALRKIKKKVVADQI